MTCQDDAKTTGPVSLFTGIETWNWTPAQFVTLAVVVKAHGIRTLFVKCAEVGSAAGDIWYGGMAGVDAIYNALKGVGMQMIPYMFLYGSSGNPSQEIAIAVQFLTKYPAFCLDMEGSPWTGQAGTDAAAALNTALVTIPNKLYLSHPADFANNNQSGFMQALSPSVNVFMPMAYSDYLVSVAIQQVQGINPQACIQPTLDLSQEFGANDVARAAQTFKNAGCFALSLWYEVFALTDLALVDKIVAVYEGTPPVSNSPPWFTFPIVVPFGNPNFDSGLGGSHDMDVKPPPNYPVTALLPGVVCDLSAPSWGKQVGIQIDGGFNGLPFMAYLHLSAINPVLKMGGRVNTGDIIGWVGGANQASQYAGTSNPTGQNFLNDLSMSSQIQVGLALMRGPVYGSGAGWKVFPPIDFTLDPTPLLQLALAAWRNTVDNPHFDTEASDCWNIVWTSVGKTPPPQGTGIFNSWKSAWTAGRQYGPPLTWEYNTIDGGGNKIIAQEFAHARCEWRNNSAFWYSIGGSL